MGGRAEREARGGKAPDRIGGGGERKKGFRVDATSQSVCDGASKPPTASLAYRRRHLFLPDLIWKERYVCIITRHVMLYLTK